MYIKKYILVTYLYNMMYNIYTIYTYIYIHYITLNITLYCICFTSHFLHRLQAMFLHPSLVDLVVVVATDAGWYGIRRWFPMIFRFFLDTIHSTILFGLFFLDFFKASAIQALFPLWVFASPWGCWIAYSCSSCRLTQWHWKTLRSQRLRRIWLDMSHYIYDIWHDAGVFNI